MKHKQNRVTSIPSVTKVNLNAICDVRKRAKGNTEVNYNTIPKRGTILTDSNDILTYLAMQY